MGEMSVLSAYSYLGKIGFVAAGLVLLNFLFKFFLKKLSLHLFPLNKEKLTALYYTPIKVLLGVVGAFISLEIVLTHFSHPEFILMLKLTRTAAVILIFLWMVLRWKRDAIGRLLEKKRRAKETADLTIFPVIDRIVTIALILVTALVLLGIFGLDITPLITFGGVGAAALGFAARDVISNFFGGMMLYITRPIGISDYILIPDKGIEGTVEEIGWYLTCVIDKEKRPLYLPNAIFSSTSLINASRRSHRTIDQRFYLTLSSLENALAIVKKLQEYVLSHPDIDKKLTNSVSLARIANGTVEIAVHAYTFVTKEMLFYELQGEMIHKMSALIQEEKGTFAKPFSQIELINS